MTLRSFFIFFLILIFCIYTRLTKFNLTFSLETDRAQAFEVADQIINRKKFILLGYGPTQVNIVAPTYHYLVAMLYYFFRNEYLITLMMSILNALIIIPIYALTRKISGVKAGLLASLLYSASYEMTVISRVLHPHTMIAFFLLLSIYLLFAEWTKANPKTLIFSVFFFLLSLMYITSYLLIPGYLVVIIFVFLTIRKNHNIFLIFPAIVLLITVFYFPVYHYHFLNNFREITSVPAVITSGNQFLNLKPFSIVSSLALQTEGFVNGFFKTPFPNINISLYFLALILFSFMLFEKSNKSYLKVSFGLIFLSGITFTGIFPGGFDISHLIIFFPLFMILLATVFAWLMQKSGKIYGPAIVSLISIFFIIQNQKNLANYLNIKIPLRNHQKSVAEFIRNEVNENTYSIYTITPYDNTGYYSLEYIYALKKLPIYQIPVSIDSRGELHYDFDAGKDYSILICREMPGKNVILEKCFKKFKAEYKWKILINQKRIDHTEIFVFKYKNNAT